MSSRALEAYLANLLDVVEGPEYTDNPADSGGPTKYGVTLRALARHRGKPVTAEDVKNLTRDEALEIARTDYVNLPGYDKLAVVNEAIAIECIDTGYNMGDQVSTVLLQRCLNTLGAGLTVDGVCGQKTCDAVLEVIKKRGQEGTSVLLKMLNCEQGARYISIAEADHSKREFVFGWFRQRIQMTPDTKFYGAVA